MALNGRYWGAKSGILARSDCSWGGSSHWDWGNSRPGVSHQGQTSPRLQMERTLRKREKSGLPQTKEQGQEIKELVLKVLDKDKLGLERGRAGQSRGRNCTEPQGMQGSESSLWGCPLCLTQKRMLPLRRSGFSGHRAQLLATELGCLARAWERRIRA